MTSEKPVRAARGLGSTGREVGVLHGVGGSCSAHNPWPAHPGPRAVSGPGSSPGSGDRPSATRTRHRSQRRTEVSTLRTWVVPGPMLPASTPGVLRFSLGLRWLSRVHVRCVDTSHLPGSLDQHTTASRTTKSIRFPAEQATEAVPLGRTPALRDGSAPVDAPDVPGVPAGCRGRRSARRTPLSPGCIRGQRPRTRCGPARRPPCAPAPRR